MVRLSRALSPSGNVSLCDSRERPVTHRLYCLSTTQAVTRASFSLTLCPISQLILEPHTVHLGRDRPPIALSLAQFSCLSSSVHQQNRAQNRKGEYRPASASPGAWRRCLEPEPTDRPESERESVGKAPGRGLSSGTAGLHSAFKVGTVLRM